MLWDWWSSVYTLTTPLIVAEFHDDVRWVPVASQCQQSRPVIFPTESKEHIVTMASGEHNVNRLINANASFTRQRDDARRTRQLAEERLNLVKKDSEYYDIPIDIDR